MRECSNLEAGSIRCLVCIRRFYIRLEECDAKLDAKEKILRSWNWMGSPAWSREELREVPALCAVLFLILLCCPRLELLVRHCMGCTYLIHRSPVSGGADLSFDTHVLL